MFRHSSRALFAVRAIPVLLAGLVLLSCGVPVLAAVAGTDDDVNPLFRAMKWREVGPYRGGRCAAVAGVPGQPNVYYFGSTGGGVWKTVDGGFTWKNVSDGFFGGSIGAVAVSGWDPNVIYAGGGEKTVRGNVSHGNGVWKSTDAGKTWTHVGLEDTRHIPRIRIHPKNSDRVWVAALGHLFGPNKQRGIFRSDDGGGTWERILHVDDKTGAVDLVLDPTNPRILYATFWRVRRTPFSLESGGDGSGIWKSVDGGDTWEDLTGNEGLPAGPLGISGITVSPSNPENLYAIIEAEEGGVFRSRDAGETWKRTNKDRSLRQRAWYYSRIYADPADEEAVYVVNVRFHRSRDGGASFEQIDTPHGDNHDLWIDPENPRRMIESNDGGANVTTDGGKTWTPQTNQPTAQIYRVSTDDDFPYRLLGGQQDNSALRIRSRSAFGGAIGTRDWEPTAGGESGHIVARPDDPDIVYGGSYGGFLTMTDHRTGERRAVNVWPDNPMGWGAADLKYRFQWNFPIFFSPHDPDLLYAAANVLFRTRDGGESWEAISPDLTRNDRSKMEPSGGPITKDNTSVEYYGTIFAALESPHEPGVLWAGSDDGLLHLSRDNGRTWEEVTPRQMPEWALINSIEAHPFEKGGLYVAATRYKLDDFRPYLYRTTDHGKTWAKITDGIEADHFTRAIRADPDRPGLLYAGTESGVYVSFDDGRHWESLQLELPISPVTDLAVKDRDLIAATQGRGFWILDDLTPLHQLTREVREAAVHLFTPRETLRLPGAGRFGGRPRNAGTNPPNGVVFHYLLAEEPDAELAIEMEILDEDGDSIQTFKRKPAPDEKKDEEDEGGEGDADEDTRLLEAEAGLNRFVWNLRYPAAKKFKRMVLWNRFLDGPRAVPGTYRARLTVGEETREVSFRVMADPRVSATQEDFQAQFDFLIGVRDKVSEAHETVSAIRELKKQLTELEARVKAGPDDGSRGDAGAAPQTAGDSGDAGDGSGRIVLDSNGMASDQDGDSGGARGGVAAVAKAVEALREELAEIEEVLYQTKMESRQDPLNYPIRLNDKLAGFLRLGAFGDHRPTAPMLEVRDELFAAIDEQLERFATLKNERFADVNRMAREAGVDFIAAR